MLITGSCLCSGVRYEAQGPVTLIARCHCTQCRKASGAEFATNASVPAATFRVLAGTELLREYEWSPGEARVFCGRCGSPLFKRSQSRSEHVRLRLGCLDSDLDQGPVAHVFVSEKPTWSEITDALPQFATSPAQRA
jgi:hypothetical protein